MDYATMIQNFNTANTAKAGAKDSKTKNSIDEAYEMGMQQFISLLVAQLQNQDMMNPTSDTEFVSQLAQFSSLQAVNNVQKSVEALNASYNTSYATSLMGKSIVAATMDDEGNVITTEGVVTGVTLFEGQPIIYIGDKAFGLGQIMVIGSAGNSNKPDTNPDEGKGDEDKTIPMTPLVPSTPVEGGDGKTPPATGGDENKTE